MREHGWTEVADGVLHRRYQPWDVNVCVVRGGEGLLLVDTRASPAQADTLRRDLAALGAGRVTRVVNTHAHFDHTFGNQRFAGLPILGHHRLAAHLEREQAEGDPVTGLVLTPPTRPVGDLHVLDLGDRGAVLRFLGRGHTDHDLLVHVPEAGAWLVGDVVEESGPPAYGDDAFPLDWPATTAALLALLGSGDTVVPGHGDPVGRDFVATQHAGLAAVADLVRDLHASGVPEPEALAAGGTRWPFPPEGLAAAVRRSYAALTAPPDP